MCTVQDIHVWPCEHCFQMREDELDNKAIRELAEFSAEKGVQILEQFENSDLNNVRNKSAYLGGVMTRFRRQTGPRQHTDVQHRLVRLASSLSCWLRNHIPQSTSMT